MSATAHDDKAHAKPDTKTSAKAAAAAEHHEDFCCACDTIAAGVKKLCDAGMGGPAAGQLAADLYCRMNGIAAAK